MLLKKFATCFAIAALVGCLSPLASAQDSAEDSQKDTDGHQCPGPKPCQPAEVTDAEDLKALGFEFGGGNVEIEINSDGSITKKPVPSDRQTDLQTMPVREVADGIYVLGDGEITPAQIEEFAERFENVRGGTPEDMERMMTDQMNQLREKTIAQIMENQGAELDDAARERLQNELRNLFTIETEEVEGAEDSASGAPSSRESGTTPGGSIQIGGDVLDDVESIERSLDQAGLQGEMRDAARAQIREKLRAILEELED